MSNDERTACSLRVIHFSRASVSDAGVLQNGAAGTRATSTGSSLEREGGRERVKRPTIAANARDRFVWATRDLRFSWLTGLSKLLQSIIKATAPNEHRRMIAAPNIYAAFAVSISSVYLPNRALLLHHAR
jgi:hypothetical protein